MSGEIFDIQLYLRFLTGKNISDISQRRHNVMIENPFILICDSFHKTERQTMVGVIMISLSGQVRAAGLDEK